MARKIVNPHLAKWAHLKDNQHCKLNVDRHRDHLWFNHLGEYHRVDENGIQDGPAMILQDGYQAWLLNGRLHRLEGPARINPSWGLQWGLQWWLDGKQLTQEGWAADPQVIRYHADQSPESVETLLKHL